MWSAIANAFQVAAIPESASMAIFLSRPGISCREVFGERRPFMQALMTRRQFTDDRPEAAILNSFDNKYGVVVFSAIPSRNLCRHQPKRVASWSLPTFASLQQTRRKARHPPAERGVSSACDFSAI